MKPILGILAQALLALTLLSVGVLFGGYGYHVTTVGLAGNRWVTASTTITYTYSVQAWGSRTGSGVEYVLYPSYSFVAADGKTYHGYQNSIFAAGKTERTLESEEELKQRLVVQDQIYYNPENPIQSAVEQPYFQLIPSVLIGAIFAIVLVIIGLGLLKDLWRGNKESASIVPKNTA